MSSNAFRYVKNHEINARKWDQCIEQAENGRIYALSWQLDRTADYWDALVWGDYEYVMPLPITRKLGFKSIYQPYYSQQLGIFPSPPAVVYAHFFNYLTKEFRYVQTHLNSDNFPVKEQKEIQLIQRKNYLLPLHNDYKTIAESYSSNTKRNIAKARKRELNYVENIRLEEYLAFKEENAKGIARKSQLKMLKSLIAYGQFHGFGKICAVYNQDNQLGAAAYFCRFKNRIIFFNAVSSPEGKQTGAMSLLLDTFIQRQAGQNLLLDFEGSMLEGLERFYKGFGAQRESYFQLKINRLPLLFKWLQP